LRLKLIARGPGAVDQLGSGLVVHGEDKVRHLDVHAGRGGGIVGVFESFFEFFAGLLVAVLEFATDGLEVDVEQRITVLGFLDGRAMEFETAGAGDEVFVHRRDGVLAAMDDEQLLVVLLDGGFGNAVAGILHVIKISEECLVVVDG